MRDVIQIVGEILTILIAIVGYTLAILRFKSSKREHRDELWLFEGLTASSAVAILVFIIFIGISSLV